MRFYLLVTVCWLAYSAVLTGATVGYYRFEEGAAGEVASGTGSVLDSGLGGNHGTPAGTPVYRTNVPVSQIPVSGAPNLLSMQFDGVSQVMFTNLFQLHASGDATVEFWLLVQSANHESVLWTRPDSTDINRFNIFTNFAAPNSFNIDPRVATAGIFSPVPISPGEWTHLAIVRSGDTNYSIYLNGALWESVVQTAALPTAVGWSISGRAGFQFHGLIDELRISDQALAPHEFLNAQTVPEPSAPALVASGLILLAGSFVIVGRFRPHIMP
jgi:hypothetical protein